MRAPISDFYIVAKAHYEWIQSSDSGETEDVVDIKLTEYCNAALGDGLKTTFDLIKAQ